MQPNSHTQSILVMRLSAMGDVAMTVPVVAAALDQNPALHVHFVTNPAWFAMFPKHERLSLIAFDKKQKHKGIPGLLNFAWAAAPKEFTHFIDLHAVARSHFLGMWYRLRRKKVFKVDKQRAARKTLLLEKSLDKPLNSMVEQYAQVFRDAGFTLNLDHKRKNFLQLNSNLDSNSVGIAPFARHAVKEYPIELMRQTVEILSANQLAISIYGSPSELEKIADWAELPGVKLVQGQGLQSELEQIANHAVMLSMDSANMHLASLVGVRVISVWGSTHVAAGFLGYGQSVEDVVQRNDLYCRPCSVYGNVSCARKDLACLYGLAPERLAEKVLQTLRGDDESLSKLL
ncbi:MAG: glycosyltransferase family 9 protein [Weeksellaceae bacterium]|nr:glycosyltransferase family 9 protein [Weeksellaceae bacterium]